VDLAIIKIIEATMTMINR